MMYKTCTLFQDFTGAIVAITHNRAFAESLDATHVLRVRVRQRLLPTLTSLSLCMAD